MIWSNEQLAAITHSTRNSGSAIVSAAAGSGKTAMLVERIIRIITDETVKIPANSIVAVTFTNDAAGELKSRLESALVNLPETAWINKQLINLESANICTISSFCINLIREYAEELGLTPGFKICEGKELEHYSGKALKYALEAIYTDLDEAERTALFSLTGEAGDIKIGKAVLDLHREYEKQAFPEQWLTERAALYRNPDEFEDSVKTKIKLEIKEKATSCSRFIKEAQSLSYSEKTNSKLNMDLKFAESWLDGESGLQTYGGGNQFGNVKSEFKEANERIKALRNRYIPIFKDIIVTAGLLADFKIVVKKQAMQVRSFIKLFKLYKNEFTRLKLENNCVCFSNAEHYCLKLLKDTETAEKIKSRFHEIIVDEFQDSNNVQYEIFRGLSRNGANLFFVGDVKQSIYRFRNADQRVFTRVMNNEDGAFKTLLLNRNYRCSKEVTDGMNKIFEAVMTEKVGGVRYDEDVKLIAVRKSLGEDYNAELVLIEPHKNEKIDEANYIASRIKKMVEDGFEVEEKDGEKRPCNYGDFAVLVSGLKNVEEDFSTAFEVYGIPFDKQKSGDYADVPEVKTALSLLTIIDRPYEDMELLEVLMSPLYNFTAYDIAEVRKGNTHKSLFDNLVSGKDKKSLEFMEDFKRWSAYIKNNGACKLIRMIYDDGVFNSLVAASAAPEKTMINIRLLLHYSAELKSLTRDNLAALIETLRDSKDVKLEEAKFTGSGENHAKLMTIHASKGLEFPICFVARTHAGFVLKENYSDIIFNENYGFAFRYIAEETRTRYDTLIHKLVREENKAAAISEEMRKLYVACTRARDKLILTGILKGDEPPENTFLNWLMRTGLNRINAENAVPCVQNNPFYKPSKKITLLKPERKDYFREPLTQIPRRFTATQIAIKQDYNASEREQDEPSVFPRMPSFMGSKRLTGKKRGDAYHKMMELLDFKNTDYKAQIYANKNRFTEEEFAAVDAGKIQGFFNSSLGMRAAKSENVCKEFKLSIEMSLSELGYPAEFDEMFSEDKPFVQGIADMFFYEAGEIILVDYKTNKNTVRVKLIEMYQKQLEIYARAIELMTGAKVKEKWIYSFELGEIKL